jgi:hypothetical protein
MCFLQQIVSSAFDITIMSLNIVMEICKHLIAKIQSMVLGANNFLINEPISMILHTMNA